MKNIVTTLLMLFLSISMPFAEARSYRSSSSDVHVKGYYNSKGTYVQSHYRSAPDGNVYNNYSYIDKGIYTSPTIKLPEITTYNPYPTYKPTSFPTPTINIKSIATPKASLTFDPLNNISKDIYSPQFITGKTSNNCKQIIVTAKNYLEGIDDVYVLTKYHYGDTSFKYGIKKDWNNLEYGINTYTFTALCDNIIVTQPITIKI